MGPVDLPRGAAITAWGAPAEGITQQRVKARPAVVDVRNCKIRSGC